MEQIKSYFQSENHSCFHRIDEHTAEDLHLDDVFLMLDYTKSAVGRQYLYKLIRCIPEKSELAGFEDWITAYPENAALRNDLNKHLKRLNHRDAYNIYPLIAEKYIPYKKKATLLFRILQLLPSLLLGFFLITKAGWLLIVLSVFVIINLIIHYRSKTISFYFRESIPQLFHLVYVAQRLAGRAEIKKLKPGIEEKLTTLNKLKSRLSLFRFDIKMESDLMVFAWATNEVIRIFFLIEPISLNAVFTLIDKQKETLKEVYAYVGLIDCLQSMAEARKHLPYYSLPGLTDSSHMEATEMYHPLIPDCVPNSFSMKEKSFLVLGSNMSGKTSFTRMAGVNTIIAQTLNICFAKGFTLGKQKVYTMLSVHDNLLQGESYYLSEVLRMKKIIDETKGGQHLILLDELFKGTNTVERIASAKAVLAYLAGNKENKIVVATHDIELLQLLSSYFTALYFTENIQDSQLSFNYKISTKPNQQRNAIRILDLYAFPDSIVNDALESAGDAGDL